MNGNEIVAIVGIVASFGGLALIVTLAIVAICRDKRVLGKFDSAVGHAEVHCKEETSSSD